MSLASNVLCGVNGWTLKNHYIQLYIQILMYLYMYTCLGICDQTNIIIFFFLEKIFLVFLEAIGRFGGGRTVHTKVIQNTGELLIQNLPHCKI